MFEITLQLLDNHFSHLSSHIIRNKFKRESIMVHILIIDATSTVSLPEKEGPDVDDGEDEQGREESSVE